jgi:Helicase conserved C-terminal domain/SNF2-related domain
MADLSQATMDWTTPETRLHSAPPALFAHQRDGIDWLVNHAGATLWHDPGLGKTRTMLEAFRRLELDGHTGAQRALIVVGPAIARQVWPHEWAAIGGDPDEIAVLQGTKGGLLPAARILVVHCDNVQHWDHLASFVTGQTLIMDEAHYWRNQGIGRARALLPIAWKAARIWQGTGTYYVNGAEDVYHQLRYLANASPFLGWSTQQFGESFGVPQWNPFLKKPRYEYVGLKDEAALLEACAAVAHHRLEEQCLDLPKARRLAHWLMKLSTDHSVGMGASQIATLREEMAPLKAKLTIDYLEQELTERPIVVFGYHHRFIDAIRHHFGMPHIDGNVSEANRTSIIERFQRNMIDVLPIQLQAGGQAITLTAARHAVFGELHWSAVDHHQAEKRIHRIGQAKATQFHYILVENSVDQLVWDVVLAKGDAISKLRKAVPIEEALRRR